MQYYFMPPPRLGSRASAFLLTQVGTHAAKMFAQRLAPLHLTPPHAGILRILDQTSVQSQRALAATLNMHASRLVVIVDELESLGLITREASDNDRRTYALRITHKGREAFAQIRQIGREHNEALCASLTPEERDLLAQLLQRIATEQGLTPGVHPGYSLMTEKKAPPPEPPS